VTYAVRFEGVTKRYSRGGPRYPSLRYELADGARRLRARLRGGRSEPRGTLALDSVSFEVGEGEAFGIIGPNGAGKTTALKLVSRITYPTDGRVRVRGRVAALIEVGSGVHPELTARENIWLYGQIMGMPKSEIRRRFDEIVEFSELGHVLDSVVKLYSSGMQLRLGFAIASHLDPDIFVVDEALAVGDAGFQAKCVERMMKLVAEGRTLLFVSHNLSAAEAICRRGAFLLEGHVEAHGHIRNVLKQYLDWIDEGRRDSKTAPGPIRGRGISIERVTLHASCGDEGYVFDTNDTVEIRCCIRVEKEMGQSWFSFGISDGRPAPLILCSMLEGTTGLHMSPGRHVVSCRVGPLPLGPHTYELWVGIREPSGGADALDWSLVSAFRIRHPKDVQGVAGITIPWLYGPVRVPHEWAVHS
jgi:ABC-type polysaccharide/polyol phosphate transport system ATPase subunit